MSKNGNPNSWPVDFVELNVSKPWTMVHVWALLRQQGSDKPFNGTWTYNICRNKLSLLCFAEAKDLHGMLLAVKREHGEYPAFVGLMRDIRHKVTVRSLGTALDIYGEIVAWYYSTLIFIPTLIATRLSSSSKYYFYPLWASNRYSSFNMGGRTLGRGVILAVTLLPLMAYAQSSSPSLAALASLYPNCSV